MKTLVVAAVIAALVPFTAVDARTKQRQTPEERLAKVLAGRDAGEPVSCIRQQNVRSTQVIDDLAIVYRMSNGVIYVNRPESGAGFLDLDDILVTDTHSPNLCDVDVVTLLDSRSKMVSGSVGLGKFVPYTKPRRDR